MRDRLAIFLALLASSFYFVAAVSNPERTEQLTVCEGEEAFLKCGSGLVIEIIRANYGRFSQKACINLEDPNTLDDLENLQKHCHNPRTADILSAKCNGLSECRFPLQPEVFFTAEEDPCPFSRQKYLDTAYRCVQATTTTSTTTTTTATTTVALITDVQREEAKIEPTVSIRRCPAKDISGVKFESTSAGSIQRAGCSEGTTGNSWWKCSSDGNWIGSFPNTSACVSDWTHTKRRDLDELKEKQDGPGLPEFLRGLTNHVHRPMQGGDLPKLVELLDDVVHLLTTEHWARIVRNLCNDKLVELVNYVSRSQSWNSWPSEKRMRFATRVISQMEKVIAWSTGDSKPPMNIVYPQPYIIVQLSDTFSSLQLPGLDYISLPTTPIWDNQDSVDVPMEALAHTGNGESRVFFSTVMNLSQHFEPHPMLRGEGNDEELVHRKVVSNIVTASILSNGKTRKIPKLDKDVYITFTHDPSDIRGLSNPQCSWWNEEKLRWYQSGCSLRKHNKTHTLCACDHLTHFAVLMDIRGHQLSEFDSQLLTALTYFGCTLSIICLLITFFCFAIFSKNGGDRVFIHKNLCLMLAAAELLFLLGIWRTENKLHCGMIAGGLLYLFLSALTWMLLEGYQLYKLLVEVFPSGSKKCVYTLIGYGFPVLVLAGAVAFDPNSFGTKDHCWLRTDNFFILAFVGPAAVILALNTVFLIMTLCIVYRHSNGGYLPCRHDGENGRNVRSWVKGALAISCLLGITWTFGLLWIDDGHSIYMAYIFTVANTLQGLAIFVFHVVLSEKMRKDIHRWFVRRGCCVSSSSNNRKGSLPRGAFSPSGGSGSGTGSEILYPSSEKYNTSPRGMDTPVQYGRHPHSLAHHYEVQQMHHHQGTYDYATIHYDDMLPGQVYRAPPAYRIHGRSPDFRPSYGSASSFYRDQYYGGLHHRPPPEFSPPPPPSQLPRALVYASRQAPSSKMSDDSAYSDGSTVLTTEVTPSGATVLRMDLGGGSKTTSRHEL